MDQNHIAALLAAPVIIGVATVAVRSWQDQRKLTAARRQPLPGGAVGVSESLQRRRFDRSGRIMLVLGGSFGAGWGTLELNILAQSGLDGAIGCILGLELDTNGADRLRKQMPPCFGDRLEMMECRELSGGLGNRSPEEVNALQKVWGPSLRRAVDAAAQRHQWLQNAAPGLILVAYGPGGQAMLSAAAIEALRGQFPEAYIAAITILPNDSLLRGRVPQIHAAMRRAGVAVTFIADNLQDVVRNDTASAVGIAAFIASGASGDAVTEFNNALRLLGRGLIAFKASIRQVPAHVHQPHPQMEPIFYVWRDLHQMAMRTALAEIQGTDGTSIGTIRDAAKDRVATPPVRFDFVATAVYPEHLKAAEDDLVEGFFGPGRSRADHHLQVISIGTGIGDSTKGVRCPVVAVSFRPLADEDGWLAQLARPQNPAHPGGLIDATVPKIVPLSEEDHHVA